MSEWFALPGRPDLGHHPDPDRPTHTRCGASLADAMPVEHPRYAHTDCLPRGTGHAELRPDGGLWEAS